MAVMILVVLAIGTLVSASAPAHSSRSWVPSRASSR